MAVKFQLPWKAINKVYRPFLDDETRLQIMFGGSASGKSWFYVQRMVRDVVKGGRNYLVVRKVAGTIRRSVFNEVAKCINLWNLKDEFDINKSDLIITCSNGYQILFAGLDDVEKLKSLTPAKGVFTDIFIEEATEVDKADVKQLRKRLRGLSRYKKRIMMAFNPIQQSHWIYEEYFEGKWAEGQKEYRADGIVILKTTYKDNEFLSEDDIAELENETDKYWYEVYSLGNWGCLGGVIFTPWDKKSENKFGTWRCEEFDKSKFDSFLYGGDFGYSQDAATAIEVHYDKKRRRLYLCDEIYAHELTNEMLANKLKPFVGSGYITYDSSEPKSIQELNEYGVRTVGAIKGKDSVNFGIQWLRQLEIIIHPKCKFAKQEFESYRWKQDKNGTPLPVPVDKNNHIIDGLRYATEHEQGTLHRTMKAEEKLKNDYGSRYKQIGMTEESGGWLSA